MHIFGKENMDAQNFNFAFNFLKIKDYFSPKLYICGKILLDKKKILTGWNIGSRHVCLLCFAQPRRH